MISSVGNCNVTNSINIEGSKKIDFDYSGNIDSKYEVVKYDACGIENKTVKYASVVACSISEFLKHLKPIKNKCLSSLIEKISIAAQQDVPAGDGSVKVEGLEATKEFIKQLNGLLSALEKLYTLPSGKRLLERLDNLLAEKKEKLFFRLELPDGESPKTSTIIREIFSERNFEKNGKAYINKAIKLHSAFINLPKSIPEEGVSLLLYDPEKAEVIKIKEPFELIIGHELIHCVQNLIYKESMINEDKAISSSIQDKIKGQIDTNEKSWYESFWGGSNTSTWPDELQAMLLGIEIDGEKISEATLIEDFLKSKTLPKIFQTYKGKRLIPFGHTDPDTPSFSIGDQKRFEELLLKVGIIKSPKESFNMTGPIQPRIVKENRESCFIF